MAAPKLLPRDWSFRHECEEFHNFKGELNCQKKFGECKKNPGHTNFIPVCDLKKEHLPQEFQTDRLMRIIQNQCNRTGKVHVTYTSSDRPDTYPGRDQPYPYSQFKDSYLVDRCGTGFIRKVKMHKDKPCPCEECKKSGHPVTVYLEVEVYTARHVVYDDQEAIQTVVECYYDTPDRAGVKLYGVKSHISSQWDPETDKIVVHCVTHDKDFMDKLIVIEPLDKTIIYEDEWSFVDQGFTVSHPHGIHKHISFGYGRFYIYRIEKQHFNSKHPGFVKCRLIRPLISQCQERKKDDKENKMYLESVTCHSLVEPDIDYLLPDTSAICLPSHHKPLDCLDACFNIPEGSGFVDSNGNLVHFPQGMVIDAELLYCKTKTYNIPTCPGSSGASVTFYKDMCDIRIVGFVHSGEDKVVGNQGCLGYYDFNSIYNFASTLKPSLVLVR